MAAVLLAEVVATSQQVAATRSRTAKVAALAGLFGRLAPDEIEVVVAFAAGEPRQGKIGVGWATLAALAPPTAALAPPTAAPAPPPATGGPGLTVLALDAALTRLGALSGPGSGVARQAVLEDLVAGAAPDEVDFVRRLLTGELRQGALAALVAEAVARAAGVPLAALRRAVMLAGDLPRMAAVAFGGGEPALAAVGLEVLRPVLPMLASTSPDAAAAVTDLGLASVEWKLDGARIQAHRARGVVRLFTRNLNDVTGRLPDVVAVLESLPVRDVVLDGEVLGLGDDDRPDRFQDTMSRFGSHEPATGHRQLSVAFFDVLHADGVDLVDRPLVERIEVLEMVAGPWRVRSVLTDDPAVAERFLEGALAAGHEGVMVKAAGSTYEAGRRGQAWRKVKPVQTLDLVVLAAEWGHGRRRGWLSNLHLGARDPDGGFVMVGKTFKGLTDAVLQWQTDQLQELATATHGPVVEVRPELVVEIALDGVQSSTRYRGGVALRFARVKGYRSDKSAADADTIEAVRSLLGPRPPAEAGPDA